MAGVGIAFFCHVSALRQYLLVLQCIQGFNFQISEILDGQDHENIVTVIYIDGQIGSPYLGIIYPVYYPLKLPLSIRR